MSLANIASSVAPHATPPNAGAPSIIGAPPNVGAPPSVAAPPTVPQPPAVPEVMQSLPAATLDAPRVPRLAAMARPSSEKPAGPPPLPSGFAINQNRAALTPAPNPALKSAPSVAPNRVAPSEPPAPPPFRAASQPHNPNPQEVDPSVYEDETVAMTAMELEAAADAQSHLPDSEPQVPEWYAPVLNAASGSTVLAAPAPPPPSFTQPQPPPWNPVGYATGNLSSSNPSAAGVVNPTGLQAPFGEANALTNLSSPAFDFEARNSGAKPTRAESWIIGKSAPSASPYPQEWRPQPTPAPASSRTLASAEPPPSDNPWLFRGLLVVLGIGGVVLGGVLGNTWLRHVLPTSTSDSSATSQAPEIMNPHLPGFDALGANERLEAAQAEAVNCLNADTAPLTGLLVARFRPTGELEALTMTGTVGSAPETPCIRSVFDKVKVPPFRGVTSQVEKALELRPRP